jgi:squalene-hopene/tetraprenyl-beta-curcumene cyclase
MKPKIAAFALVAAVLGGATYVASAPSAEVQEPAASAPEAFELQCEDEKPTTKKKVRKNDENIRASAQKGLDFLTEATIEWQNQKNCMGCHVQGVTGEALSVGRHHQYEIQDKDVDTVFSGLLDVRGGVRTDTGHAAPGGSLRPSTRAFAGASLARYDEWVSEEYGDDLINAANELIEHQDANGALMKAYSAGIVAKGPFQGTYQSIQTWQQAYARTADDRWLTAISKAEGWIQGQVDGWYQTPTTDIQVLDYAILGLMAADVGSTEKVVLDLKSRLLEAQNSDGGFPLTQGAESNALATGQALYALRMMGMNDSDAPVEKAVMWLLEAQQPDGGWSDSGAEKAEAMWAVLGLVSTDVLSVNVAGIRSGQHVDGLVTIDATAVDNEGTGVRKVIVAVDDIPVGGSCDDKTTYSWNTMGLEQGMHTVDVIATNANGKEASRRFTVYTGDHFITNVGTKFIDGGTRLSVRDIAPQNMKHDVTLEIFESVEKKGVATKGRKLFTKKVAGEQGPLDFHWKGDLGDGKIAERGEYRARLTFRDADGKVRQTRELPFVHDTDEVQANKYAQVAGKLEFADDNKDVENAVIQLIDEQGNVVQQTRSTKAGNYRFRNVKSKRKYKVRVKKKGRKAQERQLAPAAAAEEAQADFAL